MDLNVKNLCIALYINECIIINNYHSSLNRTQTIKTARKADVILPGHNP